MAARVLRHPVKRKGLVQLELCRADGTAGRELVTRRDPPATGSRAMWPGGTAGAAPGGGRDGGAHLRARCRAAPGWRVAMGPMLARF